ncbi:MAG TPA: bifunctional acetate--CoA ligase family protein/GNAT family N-acetyltransferase [Burkholderiaceae bacterium]|nr:bifunctional acetate--CoA ligase family protein/GNAT family N-acetyltransferase [Burkholderiaceae bacterium]
MDTSHYLRPALVPRSVAVVGASDRPNALGHAVFANVLAGGFKGRVYPVNPKHDQVAGVPCFPSLEALPEAPDLVVAVTPARTIPGLIEEAGKRRVRAVLVLSAGFAEIGPEGRELQDRALAAARRSGIRLLGPNCLGLMRPQIGLNATFARSPARPGSVALVSQSGAVVAALLDYAWSSGFGFSSVVSTGSGSDIEFSQILDFLASDSATRSVVLYVEGIHDARAFLSSVRATSSVKPVVVLKVGRHATGSRAALSHTGALVGDDAVFEAALRRAGAIRVGLYEELFAAAETLASGRLPRGNRLAILTNGGGPGVLAADAAADHGVALAGLSAPAREALDGFLPATWSHANPVDIIGDADSDRFARALEALLGDKENDGVLVLFTPTMELTAKDTAQRLLPIATATEKPVVTSWLGQADAGDGRAIFKEARIPALFSPEQGVESFGYLARFVRNRELRLQVPPPRVAELELDLGGARLLLDEARRAGRTVLAEDDSKSLLEYFGIEIAKGALATSAEEARRRAEEIGFPVVLKVRAEGVTHKSEVGGVLLNLRTAEEVELGFELIASRVANKAPQARFVGVLVQRMIHRPHGRELIVGLTRDPTFGPVINFGMGGIAVEILHDSAVALPPLNRLLARDLIDRTRVAKMLGAFRGMPAVDSERLLETLLRISELACELPCVRELDINPLLADEHGVVALDARVVVDDLPLQPDAAYSHLAVHPYPKALARTLTLKEGKQILLRPVRPEDVEADQRLVARLSPRSLYQRFHAPVRELSLERLARFFQIDYDREMAFAAIDVVDGIEEIRGVVRYSRNPDGASAEFGIVIEDSWQGRGLGGAMMAAIEDCAGGRGVTEMIGYVLADNDSMGLMMRALGYRPRREYSDDPGVIAFVKAIGSAAVPAAAPAPAAGARTQGPAAPDHAAQEAGGVAAAAETIRP